MDILLNRNSNITLTEFLLNGQIRRQTSHHYSRNEIKKQNLLCEFFNTSQELIEKLMFIPSSPTTSFPMIVKEALKCRKECIIANFEPYHFDLARRFESQAKKHTKATRELIRVLEGCINKTYECSKISGSERSVLGAEYNILAREFRFWDDKLDALRDNSIAKLNSAFHSQNESPSMASYNSNAVSKKKVQFGRAHILKFLSTDNANKIGKDARKDLGSTCIAHVSLSDQAPIYTPAFYSEFEPYGQLPFVSEPTPLGSMASPTADVTEQQDAFPPVHSTQSPVLLPQQLSSGLEALNIPAPGDLYGRPFPASPSKSDTYRPSTPYQEHSAAPSAISGLLPPYQTPDRDFWPSMQLYERPAVKPLEPPALPTTSITAPGSPSFTYFRRLRPASSFLSETLPQLASPGATEPIPPTDLISPPLYFPRYPPYQDPSDLEKTLSTLSLYESSEATPPEPTHATPFSSPQPFSRLDRKQVFEASGASASSLYPSTTSQFEERAGQTAMAAALYHEAPTTAPQQFPTVSPVLLQGVAVPAAHPYSSHTQDPLPQSQPSMFLSTAPRPTGAAARTSAFPLLRRSTHLPHTHSTGFIFAQAPVASAQRFFEANLPQSRTPTFCPYSFGNPPQG